MKLNSARPASLAELARLFRDGVPAEFKWALAALPLLGFIAWQSMFEPRTAPPALQRAEIVATMQPLETVNGQIAQLRRKIAERAAIDFNEDFRQGFANWDGVEDWGRSWRHDVVLGVKPAKLAFFKPSIPLRDYNFEFLGQIDKKALACVFRAADFHNYYVLKLVQTSPGPMPSVQIVRYAVVDDKPEKVTSTPLRIPVTVDTVYRVNLDVKGDLYTLYIDGKVADVWSDSRFKSGGVGFFSAKDEESRILTMRVSYQDDVIGKAAAYLTKPN